MTEKEEDPRYASDKTRIEMFKSLMDLERNTRRFVQEQNQLTMRAGQIQYRNYVEQQNNQTESDPRYYTSDARKELDSTLLKLQKVTHEFVRTHGELANKAEHFGYEDFVNRRRKS